MHRSSVVPVVLLLALPALAGCNKIAARAELKKGNALYANESYSEALAEFQKGLQLDPSATFAWKSLGFTALALYRPGDDAPKNVGYAKQATDAFEKYLVEFPDDKKVRDYLLTTYVNAKRYDDALTYLKEQTANDPAKFAGYRINILTSAGRLQEALDATLQSTLPNRAELLYSIGVSAWDKAYHQGTTMSLEDRGKIVDLGMKAIDGALAAKPDYFEAALYKNLLYRQKAPLETDANKRLEDVSQADQWLLKATQIKAQKAAAKAAPAAPAAPGAPAAAPAPPANAPATPNGTK